MEDRKILTKLAYTFSPSEFFDDNKGTEQEVIDSIRERFKNTREEYPEALDVMMDYEYYGYDGGIDICMNYTCYETDKEYKARKRKEAIDAELKAKKAATTRKRKETMLRKALEEQALTEAAERAMFEQLKAKYGE